MISFRLLLPFQLFFFVWILRSNQTAVFELCPNSTLDLTLFPPDQICGNIDLVNPKSVEKFAHCRVVSGYVSLIKVFFDQNASEITFPKLEVITDFLLLQDINSSTGEKSMQNVFPRLRSILGYHRFMNNSLYISNFYAADQIELDTLSNVCGPVWLQDSPYVCFRYSNLYWQLLSHQNLENRFDQIVDLTTNELMLDSIGENDFDARLRIHYELDHNHRHKWKKFRFIRLSIYDIDHNMYEYAKGRLEMRHRNCAEKIGNKLFTLADLIDSDKVNKILQFDFNKHLEKHQSLENLSYPSLFITTPTNNLQDKNLNFFKAHYDIRSILHFRLEPSELNIAEMRQAYNFKFNNIYFIKLSVCYGPHLDDCYLSHFRKFGPNKEFFYGKSKFSQIIDILRSNAKLFIIIVVILVTMLIFIIAIVRYRSYMNRHYQCERKNFKPNVVSANPKYTTIGGVWTWDPNFQQDVVKCDIAFEISRSNLTILPQRLLGQGEFGMVHEGILFDYGNSQNKYSGNNDCANNSRRVAIKQLRNGARQIDKDRFMLEAKYMKTFNSNFLVKLIGVCTTQEPVLAVMEFMEHGDLKNFLRNCLPFQKQMNKMVSIFSIEFMIRMSIQIADGMCYLHSKRVIHRDLAARNCMVGRNFTVKIGDFGLTRHIYEKDYYRLSEEAPLPLRWMAPESVCKLIFTQQSDVWSYGVVLWEIMNFGDQPYRENTDHEVKNILSNGECTLLQPSNSNSILWEVSKSCLNKRINKRPDFGTIIARLNPHLKSDRSQFESLSYYFTSRIPHSRPPFATFVNMITDPCLGLVSKFFHKRKIPNSIGSGQRIFPRVVVTAPFGNAHARPNTLLSQTQSTNRTAAARIRSQSFDSSESVGECSEVTALTTISNSLEANSRHNSSESEQIPLI